MIVAMLGSHLEGGLRPRVACMASLTLKIPVLGKNNIKAGFLGKQVVMFLCPYKAFLSQGKPCLDYRQFLVL